MKILIVGGAGYIGGALTDIFEWNTHDEIVIYDSLVFEDAYRKKYKFINGDIRDHQKLGAALEGVDCVVWLAALVGDGACAINPALTKEINQDSVKWLADNFNGRIIFMSTCSVYGAQDGDLEEDSPTNPLSVYASTKLAAEAYLKDKNAIIFRLGTLFGIGDTYSRLRLDLVVNTMVARAISEGKLSVFGGDQYRPLLHVKDAALAIKMNIDSNLRGVYNLRCYNMKILDLAKQVKQRIPCTLDIVETTFEDARNYKASSRKAELDFNFRFGFGVDTGIEEMKQLIEEGRIKDLNNPRYSNQRYMEFIHATKR